MLLCKMSKKKEAREVISFSFLIASGIIGTLLGSLHELPASSNCPSSFMFQLWKILLPLVTTLYEMQWLEVLVPTLTGNPTMPFNYHCQTSIQRTGKETATVWLCNNLILHIERHFSPLFWSKLILNKVLHMCSKLIWILVTNSLVLNVITTMLVIMVTLITITVLPKLTLFWV